ncbi:ribonuclease H-like domain-containing protein [Tanacetum coccineum]
MSVHNSEHNSPNNSNHDEDIHDYVTRISKLDISDQLHLHPNDTTTLTILSIKLKGTENYQVWSCAMLLALEGKNKIGFIDGSCKRSNTDEVLGKQWDRVNAIVLGWILNSISEELLLGQKILKRANHVWEELKETYDKVDGSIMFGLHNQINTLKQNGSSIADYYHKLNALWKRYDAIIELPKCVCNASEETLPDVRSAYATISSEESHRVVVGSIAGSSKRNQASAFVQGGGSGLNINRPSGASGLVCENYGFNGHTIDRCFKIIGYPADFGKKKSGQNFKKQSVSNNNSVGKSSSSGFTDEQMATLISLIKDNKVGKNMQANMAGANQHMTYTDKELDNILDISHLKIKVDHPNGTEAYISKIGNLILSNGLTLYDVLVIPEYCITLISVHKLIKENKHDWHCRLGHPADPVLNVLKDSLNIDKKDNTVCHEICQRTKQTRESFPLSDHKSKSLGDLVHLDLWGPYKVTSFEGFRFFLTVVDDYTRAVWVYLIKSKDEIPYALGGIPLKMWTECILTSTYLINRLPSSVLNGKSPYEMIYKKCPTLSHLRVFGCLCFATIINNNDKFSSRYEKCVMIGYSNFKKGYRLYSLDKHQFIFSRDVKFFENIFPFKDSKVGKNDSTNVFQDVNHINFFDTEYPEIPNDDERVANDLNKGKSNSSNSSVSGSTINTADFLVDSGNDADSSNDFVATQNEEVATLEENIFSEGNLDQNPSSSQGVQNVRRSSRQSVFPKNYNDFVVESKFHWTDAMNQEIDALLRTGTWELVDLPEDIKLDWCLLNIVVSMSWPIFQLDVMNAFLYGDLEEVVFLKPSEGYFLSDNKVCRLKESLYGLKQAPRQWNAKLTSTLIKNGFSQSKSDYSLYTKSDKGCFLPCWFMWMILSLLVIVFLRLRSLMCFLSLNS